MKLMSRPIPSFDHYFRSLRPENNTRNPWFQEYWQWKFDCYLDWLPLSEQNLSSNTSCTGKQSSEIERTYKIRKQQTRFMRISNYSYTMDCLPVRGDNPRALAS